MNSTLVGAASAATRPNALLRFMLLGAALFGLKSLLPENGPGPLAAAPIRVSAAEVERLRAEWLAETRRPPDASELEAMIRRHGDEEALVREALRLGLDRSDPVVRTRLVQNLRFARGEPEGDARPLFAEALALGMATRDVVARRRLVQAVEERIVAGVRVADEEVSDYIAAHPRRYGAARRLSFEQVFVAATADTDRRARELGAELRAGAAVAGDPFLLGARFERQSQSDLARSFGAAFAAAAMLAPAGAWSGPIRSVYGAHFIRVHAVDAGAAADVAAVRRQARYALLEERERQAVQARLQDLRRAYPLEVEPPALAMAVAR